MPPKTFHLCLTGLRRSARELADARNAYVLLRATGITALRLSGTLSRSTHLPFRGAPTALIRGPATKISGATGFATINSHRHVRHGLDLTTRTPLTICTTTSLIGRHSFSRLSTTQRLSFFLATTGTLECRSHRSRSWLKTCEHRQLRTTTKALHKTQRN